MRKDLAGHFLVAPPNISDPGFHDTAVLMISHTARGSWGIIVNKPLRDLSVRKLGRKLGQPSTLSGQVYYGGPIQNTTINVIHTSDVQSVMSQEIFPGVCITGDANFVDNILTGVEIPAHYRFVLGISSWAPGQLEHELAGNPPWDPKNSWLHAPADIETLFELDDNAQWTTCVEAAISQIVKNVLA